MRRPPRASESNISFSFEIVLLRQVSLAWSNRGGVRSGPCIQVFGVRQGSRRRGAEGHFHLSRRVGRDWPVMRVIHSESVNGRRRFNRNVFRASVITTLSLRAL